MSTPNSKIVPFELALKLKKLGFNEICYYYWCQIMNGDSVFDNAWNKNSEEWLSADNLASAPYWQDVFDWFYEKHHLYSNFPCDFVGNTLYSRLFDYHITKSSEEEWYLSAEEVFTQLSLLDVKTKCLEKLIEIVEADKQLKEKLKL